MSGDRLDRLMLAPSKELELAPESVRAFAVEQAAGSGQQQSAPLPKQQAVASNMGLKNISLPFPINVASVNADATLVNAIWATLVNADVAPKTPELLPVPATPVVQEPMAHGRDHHTHHRDPPPRPVSPVAQEPLAHGKDHHTHPQHVEPVPSKLMMARPKRHAAAKAQPRQCGRGRMAEKPINAPTQARLADKLPAQHLEPVPSKLMLAGPKRGAGSVAGFMRRSSGAAQLAKQRPVVDVEDEEVVAPPGKRARATEGPSKQTLNGVLGPMQALCPGPDGKPSVACGSVPSVPVFMRRLEGWLARRSVPAIRDLCKQWGVLRKAKNAEGISILRPIADIKQAIQARMIEIFGPHTVTGDAYLALQLGAIDLQHATVYEIRAMCHQWGVKMDAKNAEDKWFHRLGADLKQEIQEKMRERLAAVLQSIRACRDGAVPEVLLGIKDLLGPNPI